MWKQAFDKVREAGALGETLSLQNFHIIYIAVVLFIVDVDLNADS